MKAVFIDRDGVINNDEGHYYIFKKTDFKLNEGILDNICLLKKAGYLVIIISNQGGIGKGLYTKNDTDALHNLLEIELQKHNCKLDAIYYCPHHNDSGLCLCRKPSSLLIEKSIARFGIDIHKSFLIGDSNRDIEAAQKAGIRGILVQKNTNISDVCIKIIDGIV
jgi:D-glycero-D-manno-heptose 1,7-bisphosphate phosphatase